MTGPFQFNEHDNDPPKLTGNTNTIGGRSVKKGYSALLFVALILSMALAACTSGTPEPPPKAAVKEDLVMAINAEPTGLDPATGNDLLTFIVERGEKVIGLFVQGLLAGDSSETQ
jgi:ABC-type transport system substrate-binding protein